MPTPKELLTRLNHKLNPPPPPERFEYAPWSSPDPANLPNEADARREGARALARSSLYATSEDERRDQIEQANLLAESFMRGQNR